MALDASRLDTPYQNFRRLMSARNIIVYLINPTFAWAGFFYIVLNAKGFSRAHFRWRLYLGIAFQFFTITLQIITAESIKSQFRRAGFVLKRTLERDLDMALSCAACGAGILWIYRRNPDDDRKDSDVNMLEIYGLIVSSGFVVWGALFLVLLGPTVYYSQRPTRTS